MTKILLQSYKNEYQTTDISIDNLCLKYSLDKNNLTGSDEWEKQIVPTNIDKVQEETLDVSVIDEQNNPMVLTDRQEVLNDIDAFKKEAVKECLRFIKDDARYSEVKEFKDMVSIIDSIEKSYKDTKDTEGTTVNILIQNLTQKFKDTPDDC